MAKGFSRTQRWGSRLYLLAIVAGFAFAGPAHEGCAAILADEILRARGHGHKPNAAREPYGSILMRRGRPDDNAGRAE